MTLEADAKTTDFYTRITSDVVSAYVSHNSVPPNEVSSLLNQVHSALVTLGQAPREAVPDVKLAPAVNPKKSVTNEYIICLEDGKRYKSLKRHLTSAYGMTPDQYRSKWGLAKDYPMVAPAYAAMRSSLARDLGLGRRGVPTADEGAGQRRDVPETLPAPVIPASAIAPSPKGKGAVAAAPVTQTRVEPIPEPSAPKASPRPRGRRRNADPVEAAAPVA